MRFWAEKGEIWARCGVQMRQSCGAAAMGGNVRRYGAGIYGAAPQVPLPPYNSMGLPHQSSSTLWGCPTGLPPTLYPYKAVPQILYHPMGLPPKFPSHPITLWGCPMDPCPPYGSAPRVAHPTGLTLEMLFDVTGPLIYGAAPLWGSSAVGQSCGVAPLWGGSAMGWLCYRAALLWGRAMGQLRYGVAPLWGGCSGSGHFPISSGRMQRAKGNSPGGADFGVKKGDFGFSSLGP